MLTKKEEDIASVKNIAKARPRQKPTVSLTFVSIPVLERKWIDIETQRSHGHKCYEVSKAMTRLLRHGQSVPRGSDGAIHYSDIIEECRKKKFDDASQWLLEDWISTLAKGGGAKKRFQYCVNPNSSNQFQVNCNGWLLVSGCRSTNQQLTDAPGHCGSGRPLDKKLCVWAGHTEAGGELNGPPDSFSTELCVWWATQRSRGN